MEDENRSPSRMRREERIAETSDDLLSTSGGLLARIRELRRLEERKRRTGISSDEFHRLAEEVERQSREIWRLAEQEASLAGRETGLGNETGAPSDRTLNEVDARQGARADVGDLDGVSGLARIDDGDGTDSAGPD